MSYHKKCYNDYNDNHLQRLKKSLAIKNDENSFSTKDTRKRSQDNWQLCDLLCAICSENDVYHNLHMAAEVEGKKIRLEPKDHLKQKTDVRYPIIHAFFIWSSAIWLISASYLL